MTGNMCRCGTYLAHPQGDSRRRAQDGNVSRVREHVMSAAENIRSLSADAYVQEMLRAAEAQSAHRQRSSRRAFLSSPAWPAAAWCSRSTWASAPTALANRRQRKEFAPNAFLRIAPDGTITHLFEEPGDRPGHQDRVPDDHRRRARCRLVAGAASSRRRSIRPCTAARAPAARARSRRTGISCAVPARRPRDAGQRRREGMERSAKPRSPPRTAPSFTRRAIASSSYGELATARPRHCRCRMRSRSS